MAYYLGWDTVPQVAEHAITAIKIVVPVWSGNFLLRTVSMRALQHYGLLNPHIDAYWPRFIPWRPLKKFHQAFTEWREEHFSFGEKSTGGFLAVSSTLAERYSPGDIVLGRARLWGGIPSMQYVGYKPERSMLVFGMTGSGKTNWTLQQIALTPENASIVNIDVKGIAQRTVMPVKRRQGVNVQCIDVLGDETASINVTQLIREINEATGRDLTTIIVEGIAQALVPQDAGSKEQFWTIQAWEVWKAGILHEISINPNATLMDVYDRLFRGYWEHCEDKTKALDLYFHSWADNPSFDGFIARIGAALLTMNSRTRSGILPSGTGPTAWLGHPNTKRFLGPRHSFNLCDLKGDKPLILNLACPPGELRSTYAGFFRMMMYLTVKVLELVPNNLTRKEPTRKVWDENKKPEQLPPAAVSIRPQLRGIQA